MSEQPYTIGNKETLQEITRDRGKIYDDLIKAVKKLEVGAYPVTVGNMDPKKLHSALSNKLKGDTSLRPRIRGNKVYLQVIEHEKQKQPSKKA